MLQPFIVNLVFGISCEGVFTDQYEEQLRLVFSENEDGGIHKGRIIAKEIAGHFTDRLGRIMEWKFIAVKDISRVKLDNGSLLYSSIKETEPIGMI